eukprot:TRINITY_DN1491_c0_g1_i1.p1 TRINITY_DN1491_c0_g1~~TRINITY_DN1491_c0_g1_i1.p1  ORF type:complete len:351 (+),score=67.88 TRINITY_DN1491_c0_g1_i1:104-1156(+)
MNSRMLIVALTLLLVTNATVIASVVFNPKANVPIVVNTWPFIDATREAWRVLSRNGSHLDAVEAGCTVCEVLQCDGTVGYGGSPNEQGESTLDAMLMDSEVHDVGAVAVMKRIKSAISVARKVLEHTSHTLLVGEDATKFAVSMGFVEEDLSTPDSKKRHEDWLKNSCQPNYWRNVLPDPTRSCGPYAPIVTEHTVQSKDLSHYIDRYNHDTIGMVAIDNQGRIAAGTSTNGLSFRVPGRVGDSPITGAGAYAEKGIGGAAGTGDGDVLARFLPSFQAVRNMADGMTPKEAAEDALRRILRFYPNFSGGLVAVNARGEHGGAGHGFSFSYSVQSSTTGDAIVVPVAPISL